jgi:hypothetical protein
MSRVVFRSIECTSISEEILVFIEIEEQLGLFPVCEGIGSWGRRGLGRTDILGSMTAYLGRTILYGWHVVGETSGARFSYVLCVVSLKSRRLGCYKVSGSTTRVEWDPLLGWTLSSGWFVARMRSSTRMDHRLGMHPCLGMVSRVHGCYKVSGSTTRVGWSGRLNRLSPNDFDGLW